MWLLGFIRAVIGPSGGEDADRPAGRGLSSQVCFFHCFFRSQTGWPKAPQTCPLGRGLQDDVLSHPPLNQETRPMHLHRAGFVYIS